MESKVDKTIWYLSNFNVFKALDKASMMELAGLMHHKECPKDQIMYLQNDKSDRVFFLKDGKVKISSISKEGKEMIHSLIMPGEIFGELSLVAAGTEERGNIAEVIESGVICSMEADKMAKFLESRPSVNLEIQKLIGFRFKKIQRKLSDLWFKTAPERIREFIKEMAKDYGKPVGHELVIRMKLTHQDIASMTATARQTVTTTLSQLENDGLITYDRSRILVRKVDEL